MIIKSKHQRSIIALRIRFDFRELMLHHSDIYRFTVLAKEAGLLEKGENR